MLKNYMRSRDEMRHAEARRRENAKLRERANCTCDRAAREQLLIFADDLDNEAEASEDNETARN